MRLATLAILACLASLASGQDAPKAADDPKVVAALRKMGATLVHEGGEPKRPVVAVTISRTAIKEIDEALSLLAKLPQVRELTLSGTSLTSRDRKHLQSLTALRTLRLDAMIVGKKDLEALDALKELRSLDLAGSVLDWRAPDGLSYARRRELRVLKLWGELGS